CAGIEVGRVEQGTLRRCWTPARLGAAEFVSHDPLVPESRARYLAEIAANGRRARKDAERAVEAARTAHGLYRSLASLHDAPLPAPLEPYPQDALDASSDATRRALRAEYNRALQAIGNENLEQLRRWPQRLD